MNTEVDAPSLYDLTGDIKDINTLIVNRNVARAGLPLWRKLVLCWRNWRRYGKFRLSMA